MRRYGIVLVVPFLVFASRSLPAQEAAPGAPSVAQILQANDRALLENLRTYVVSNPAAEDLEQAFMVIFELRHRERLVPRKRVAGTRLPKAAARWFSAWLSLVGSPRYQAKALHKTTPQMAAPTVARSTASGCTIPTPMVAATAVPAKAPSTLKTTARSTAWPGDRTRVETTVAIAFGASVQPFRNSATRTSARTSRSPKYDSTIERVTRASGRWSRRPSQRPRSDPCRFPESRVSPST